MRILAVALTLAIAASAGAQETVELTADEIVRRHVEALGGEDALRALTTLKKTGTYVYNGHEHPIVSYHKTGKRSREEIEGLRLWAAQFAEGNVVRRGTNGSAVWLEDPSREERWLEIPERREALTLEDADLHGSIVDYAAKGHRITYEGMGELDGTSAHRVRIHLASGPEQLLYFDPDTFLLLGKEIEGEQRDDLELPRRWFYDDYRAVGGVQVPFWVFVEEPIFTREYTYDAIEANVPLEDSLFEPPPGASSSR